MSSLLKSLFAKAGFHLTKRSEAGDFMLEGISSPLKYLLWRELLWGHIKTIRGLNFVQIGANDGAGVDPIRQLIERNKWRGVCVEPLPTPYAQLVKNYAHLPEVKTVRAAIFEKAGSKTMYTVDATKVPGSTASYPSAYSSFFREHVVKFGNLVPNIEEIIVEEEVPCITMDQLLSERGITEFDLLQIDAEGYDAEIIKMIDFSKVSPRFINFEHCNLQPGELESVLELLIAQGYQFCMGSMDTAAVKSSGGTKER